MRILLLFVSLLLSTAAAPAEIPEVLRDNFDQEEFHPRDFIWLRGGFAEADEAQKADFENIQSWLKSCSHAAKEDAKSKLLEMGVADAVLAQGSIQGALCSQVSWPSDLSAYASFADFSQNLRTTRPIFDALIATTELAERIAGPNSDSLAEELLHRPLAEQIYRNALSWTQISGPPDGIPALTDKQKAIFLALLWAEIGRRDRGNTEWLKGVIDRQGWPTISLVGKDASRRAWLLAQHADHDPVFQLRVLRLMEPLVADEEVSSRDYAYLYDRVMLKLVGTQRFATQVTCEGGKYVPLPLEDEAKMPAFRRKYGLGTFAEYLEMFSRPCPEV